MDTVPSWQVKIRAAQALNEERIAAHLAEKDAKQREMDKGNAAKLKRALAYFGIDAEPDRNEWVQDEYGFRLERERFTDEGNAGLFIDENGLVSFTLIVYRPDTCVLWRDLPGYQDPYYQLSEMVKVRGLAVNAADEDLQESRTDLAYALDMLDTKHEEVVKRAAQSVKDEDEEHEYVSVATQLARLIGQLVGEEVRNQLGNVE